jgi:hypothetical protein
MVPAVPTVRVVHVVPSAEVLKFAFVPPFVPEPNAAKTEFAYVTPDKPEAAVSAAVRVLPPGSLFVQVTASLDVHTTLLATVKRFSDPEATHKLVPLYA